MTAPAEVEYPYWGYEPRRDAGIRGKCYCQHPAVGVTRFYDGHGSRDVLHCEDHLPKPSGGQ